MNGQTRGRRSARGWLAWLFALLAIGSTTANATAIGMVFTTPTQAGQVVSFIAQETASGAYPFSSDVSADTYFALLHATCDVSSVCDTWKGRYSYMLTDLATGGASIVVTFNVTELDPETELPLFRIKFYEFTTPLDPDDQRFADFPVVESLPRSTAAQCTPGTLYSCEFESEFVFMRGDSWLGIVTLAQDVPEPATVVLVLLALGAMAARRTRSG